MINGLKIPDVDEKLCFRAQNGIVFSIEVIRDDCSLNPMEDDDGNGKIHSFSTRHSNFLDLTKYGCFSVEKAIEQLNFMFGERGKGWMPLSYEHGNCSWFPMGDCPAGVEFRWDGTRFAGVWEMDKLVQQNLSHWPEEEYAKRAYEYCKGVCNEYTNWCNGWVYGFAIEFIKSDSDENEDKDSCFGFFGWEWEKNGMLDYVLNSLGCRGIETVHEVKEGELFSTIVDTEWMSTEDTRVEDADR